MTYSPPRPGQTITSTMLEGMVGEWQDYTVTWTASTTNPTLGSLGSLIGRYAVIGDTVHFQIKLTGGSDTTWGSGSYSFSLPVAAAGSSDFVGDCFVGDSSGGSSAYSTGIAFIGSGGTTVGGYVGAKNGASAISNANPQAMASGDRIWLMGTYEAA